MKRVIVLMMIVMLLTSCSKVKNKLNTLRDGVTNAANIGNKATDYYTSLRKEHKYQPNHINDYFDNTMKATETILKCLSEDNANGIKNVLSKRTRELPDIDKQIQNMLKYFDGKVLNYNKDQMSVSKTSASKDNWVYTEISAYGHIPDIVTDMGKKYKELYIFYCQVDVKEPDLVGVYAVVVEGDDGTKCSIELPKE